MGIVGIIIIGLIIIVIFAIIDENIDNPYYDMFKLGSKGCIWVLSAIMTLASVFMFLVSGCEP